MLLTSANSVGVNGRSPTIGLCKVDATGPRELIGRVVVLTIDCTRIVSSLEVCDGANVSRVVLTINSCCGCNALVDSDDSVDVLGGVAARPGSRELLALTSDLLVCITLSVTSVVVVSCNVVIHGWLLDDRGSECLEGS